MKTKAESASQSFWSRLNEKNPHAIVWILLLGLGLLFSVPLVFQIRVLGALNPAIKVLRQDLETSRNNILRLPAYQKELQSLRSRLDAMQAAIQTRDQLPHIQEKLSRLATKQGLEIEQIFPNRPEEELILKTDEGPFFALPIVLELRGGYHAFGRFLNTLERESPFLRIAKISVAGQKDHPRRHKIALTVQVVVFEKVEEGN